MSDEIELTGHQVGIDRREIIKRGAILGGVVWAAPVIQSIGSPAFAETPTPGTIPTEEPGDLSFIAAVLVCNGDKYRVKYNIEGGWDPEPGPPEGHKHCNPDGYGDPDTEPVNGYELGLRVYADGDQWVLFVPTVVNINDKSCLLDDAVAFAGPPPEQGDDGVCEPPVSEEACEFEEVLGTCHFFDSK